MSDYLLGEDTVDLAELGFCGDTITVSCPTCGEVLGHIPVELLSDGLEELTTTYINRARFSHKFLLRTSGRAVALRRVYGYLKVAQANAGQAVKLLWSKIDPIMQQ